MILKNTSTLWIIFLLLIILPNCIKKYVSSRENSKSDKNSVASLSLLKELKSYQDWIAKNPPNLADKVKNGPRRFGTELEFGCKDCSDGEYYTEVNILDMIGVYAGLRAQFTDLIKKPSTTNIFPIRKAHLEEVSSEILKNKANRYCKRLDENSAMDGLEIYCYASDLNNSKSTERLEIRSSYSRAKLSIEMSVIENSTSGADRWRQLTKVAKELKNEALANPTLAKDSIFNLPIEISSHSGFIPCAYIWREKSAYCGAEVIAAAAETDIVPTLLKKHDSFRIPLISLENEYLALDDILDQSAGFEVRTKPLEANYIEKAFSVFSGLRNIGSKGVSDRVNASSTSEGEQRTTGLHVHVEAERSLTGQDVARVLWAYFELESDILNIFSPAKVRLDSEYVRPYSEQVKEKIRSATNDVNLATSEGLAVLAKTIVDGEPEKVEGWAKFHLFNVLNVLKSVPLPHTFECRLFDAEYKKSFNEGSPLQLSPDDYFKLAIAACYYIIESGLGTENFEEFKKSVDAQNSVL